MSLARLSADTLNVIKGIEALSPNELEDLIIELRDEWWDRFSTEYQERSLLSNILDAIREWRNHQ